MKVLILGASGYIGFAVAKAVRANGHDVIGVVRSEEAREKLEGEEIATIVGDADSLEVYEAALHSVGAVISVSGTSNFKNLEQVLKKLKELGKSGGHKRKFIFCSGVLDYVDSPGQVLDEYSPIQAVPRTEFSLELLRNDDVVGTVLRPGFVYGRSFGKYASGWFTADDTVEVDGKPDKEWSWVHVDDVASAFAAVVDAPDAVVAGQVFNVTDDATKISYRDMRILFAKKAGGSAQQTQAKESGWPMGDISSYASSAKLRRHLGWSPKHGPLQANIDTYYKAFQALKK